MLRPIARSRLGRNILVVVDRTPEFLDRLQSVVARLPNLADRSFLLMCCCPPRYWEHGGADNEDVQRDVHTAWHQAEQDFTAAVCCLDQAKAMLVACGVPPAQIRVKTGTDNSTLEATMAEIQRGQYSGILVSRLHEDLVNRLIGRGLSDLFRRVPKVDVWPIDDE